MKKIGIQNLGMIITDDCTLRCAHCMRGDCVKRKMSHEVIRATLDQIAYIGNLAICGGEPTLALDVLEYILKYIVENRKLVNQLSMVINGTIYDFYLIELYNYISLYTKTSKDRSYFNISYDEYHLSEIKRLHLEEQFVENVRRYAQSEYFLTLNPITKKLFREGRASQLDPSLTVEMQAILPVITYVGKGKNFDQENGFCNIGPLVTVNTQGIITECDASTINQERKYNYGNVLKDSIEESLLKQHAKVLTPRKWQRETAHLIKYQQTYE